MLGLSVRTLCPSKSRSEREVSSPARSQPRKTTYPPIKTYSETSPPTRTSRETRSWRSPVWIDTILLIGILLLAIAVSYFVLETEGTSTALGIFVTALGLVLALASQYWKLARKISYYGGLGLGVIGLITTLCNLV